MWRACCMLCGPHIISLSFISAETLDRHRKAFTKDHVLCQHLLSGSLDSPHSAESINLHRYPSQCNDIYVVAIFLTNGGHVARFVVPTSPHSFLAALRLLLGTLLFSDSILHNAMTLRGGYGNRSPGGCLRFVSCWCA
jgi:hypothetical protein